MILRTIGLLVLLIHTGGTMISSQSLYKSDILLLNKTLTYSAVYKNSGGDTLSNEFIKVYSTGKPWEHAPDSQQEVIYEYNFLNTDTAQFTPTLHGNPIIWNTTETTGYIYNKSTNYHWTHPFRENQYYITEIAPFPNTRYILDWSQKSTISIFPEWGKFKGKSRIKAKPVKYETVINNGLSIPDCIKVSAKSRHRLGKSYLISHFHPDYGFTRLDYTFFNGSTLLISLIDISDK